MQSQAHYKQLQPGDYIDDGYVFTGIGGKVINPNYICKDKKIESRLNENP